MLSSGDFILQALSPEAAGNWLAVSQTLADLEAISPASPAGRAWQDILAERLAELGRPLSVGYLRKLRRVRRLIDTEVAARLGGRTPTPSDLSRASFLALEAVERLMALDPDAGRAALDKALDGASQSAILAALREAQLRHPERLTARHAGWRTRRETATRPSLEEAVAQAMMRRPEEWMPKAARAPATFRPTEMLSVLAPTPLGVYAPRIEPAHDLLLVGMRAVEPGVALPTTESVLLQSEFFDLYWLVTSADSGTLQGLLDSAAEYGAGTVGAVRVVGETLEAVSLVSRPGTGYRRERLVEAIQTARAVRTFR